MIDHFEKIYIYLSPNSVQSFIKILKVGEKKIKVIGHDCYCNTFKRNCDCYSILLLFRVGIFYNLLVTFRL